MATRIYKVSYDNRVWFVRASTRNQAIAYIAGKAMKVEVASQEDLVAWVAAGSDIEDVHNPLED